MRIAGAIACLQRVRLEGRAGGATAGVTDRHDIYLTYGFLHNIWFSHKYDIDRAAVLEHMGDDDLTVSVTPPGKRRKDAAASDVGILDSWW
jgi:hypothetical protein